MTPSVAFDGRRNSLGRSGLLVTPLTVGGGPLGSMPRNFGYEVARERGVATAVAAVTGPLNALDTSSAYSGGESESRIGEAIARVGGLPPGFVLSTKVSRDLETGDFSGDQMRRSMEGSLTRLGLSRVPLLYLHDPEHITFEEAIAPAGPVEALRALRDTGVASAIGVAGGPTALLRRYVETDLFDVVLTHNRFTLVNRSADALIQDAYRRGLGVVNAAVLGGGILATGVAATTRYAYREADPALLRAIREIEAVCRAAGVPLAAAAIQFSVRDPRIATTIVGVSRPERVRENVALASLPIPEELWGKIDGIAAAAGPLAGPD